jgi:hypothetical protein
LAEFWKGKPVSEIKKILCPEPESL